MIPVSTSQTRVPSLFSLSILYYKFPHPPLLKAPPVPNSFFPPCTHFSRYWPRPPVPVPGGCHGGWVSHSQGCSVHSSHRLPWGLPLSAAVGCLPTMRERGKRIKRHINGIHCIFHEIGFWIGKIFFSTCNVFIESDCNQKKEMKESTGIIL